MKISEVERSVHKVLLNIRLCQYLIARIGMSSPGSVGSNETRFGNLTSGHNVRYFAPLVLDIFIGFSIISSRMPIKYEKVFLKYKLKSIQYRGEGTTSLSNSSSKFWTQRRKLNLRRGINDQCG